MKNIFLKIDRDLLTVETAPAVIEMGHYLLKDSGVRAILVVVKNNSSVQDFPTRSIVEKFAGVIVVDRSEAMLFPECKGIRVIKSRGSDELDLKAEFITASVTGRVRSVTRSDLGIKEPDTILYRFKAGENCKFDRSCRYVDRVAPDSNGFMTPTCKEIDSLIVPADKAEEVAEALNQILGNCEVKHKG